MMTRSLNLSNPRLSEATSIALAQNLQYQNIQTPLSEEPIATAYVRQGTGDPPVVLLHGFDSSVFEFRRLLPLLAEHQATWAIDLLGFGFTDRPAQFAFSPTAIKTHLYYCWKTWIGQPMVLVGASMGGAAAIDFALTYPDAVQKLILLDSAGYTVGPPIAKYLIPVVGKLATNFLRSPKVRQNIAVKAYHDPSFASEDAACCAALHLDHPSWQDALIAFTQSGGYGSFKQQLPQIQQPTLILWGENDRILGTKDATRFEQAIPQSRLIWIQNAGHVPHLEQPKQTAVHIQDFLAT